MPVIQLPQIYCPFPPAMNRFAEQADIHDTTWVQQFGLVNTEKAKERFRRARFAALSSRAFPTAGRKELFIAAEFNTWLFLLDDKNDESMFGKMDFLDMIYSAVMSILDNKMVIAPKEVSPLTESFADLWSRMKKISTPAWQLRFVQSMKDYLDACIWEAGNRINQLSPSVADYIEKRPYTGALFADIELIEVVEKIYLPERVYAHETVKQLSLACNNVVCWANDIFSFDKERRHGDVHNLVLVLKEERNLTLAEALEETARMHDAEVERFISLSEQLPYFSEIINSELERYVSILRAWMRANMDWSFSDTARYQVNVTEEVTGKWTFSEKV